ncbi:phospholipase D family protein [Chachezhania antarctica]|uniref:phospholipase D family protein n=1 Tax=Chachezhania antarctica TaxID=2340860 RepID=UPI000EAF0DB1|nr:phospholipase D family protein [Chachezhania antarctica]|tara:strand:- start:6667 stop:8202 length:1536 start_codon:yes stop_codon:yes gene_type:complete
MEIAVHGHATEGAAAEACGAKALITAEEGFPALERLALGAKEELLLSFRIFDPETRLRSDEARALGLDRWRDLVAHVSDSGVDVKLLLTDFDPIFATDLHIDAWHAAEGFKKAAPKMRVLLHHHPARIGPVWRLMLAPKIRSCIRAIQEDGRTEATPAIKGCLTGTARIYPATLHQKLAVADGDHMIIGGLDVDERRYDTQDHDQPSEETWHDCAVDITGESAKAGRRHFIKTWNAAIALRDDFDPLPDNVTPMDVPPRVPETGPIRVLRTVSQPVAGPAAFGPVNAHAEIEAAHLELFAKAERFIYIETQFFRHFGLAEALAKAAERAPDLQCVMVLPVAPERILFDKNRGVDARHAQGLQIRCIDRIRKAFGDRLAVVVPARPGNGNGDVLYRGADIVYVHAKVTVVDDAHAIIGSANLNGRSMRWDTEASVQIDDARFARNLRDRLIEHWLGDTDAGIDPSRAAIWTDRAKANADRKPDVRQDFILPYPTARTRAFSLYAPVLPAEMF